jgi:hypothetical protein
MICMAMTEYLIPNNESRKTSNCPFESLVFIMMYNMWVNDCPFWPVYKPEWGKKDKGQCPGNLDSL